ncbi:MAG: hypothetical protein D3922_01180, partial [Candidatus Electrothrix sp. AR1]|nr:hypothetical protein [Candidatus Electrothrix sp. AR1]
MAGQLWTDFNAHDPGITILEQLCYAITDLGRRINYPIPDLLAGRTTDSNCLYPPAQILPSAPVTREDLRKLLIDVTGVKNAWIEPVEAQKLPLYFNTDKKSLSLQGDSLTAEPVHLKGLYQVLIEPIELGDSNTTVSEQHTRIEADVIACLHAHRSLGEDIEGIKILTPQYVRVRADIEIDRVNDAEKLLQQVYQKLAAHISPVIPFHSLSELLAQGRQIDEAFTGPLLKHGFIDADALAAAQRRTVLRTSDLLQIIMDVPGVRAVRLIRIAVGDAWQDWSLDLDPNMAPKLDIETSAIRLERNRLLVGLNSSGVGVQSTNNQSIREQQADSEISNSDISPPPGRNRNVENYTSIQHQFPAAYGIGPVGLPQSVPPERKAQAGQLRAYLLFFDQLLANYFSQLAQLGDLFSCAGNETTGEVSARTYFARAVHGSELDFAALYIKKNPEEHQARLDQIAVDPYTSSASDTDGEKKPKDFLRRNRFLNHLLARFAEQFTDYAMTMYKEAEPSADTGAGEQEGQVAAQKKLIRDKSQFMQQYPQLSRDRGRAFNYLQTRSTDNISGLEQRLNAKLGLELEEQFYLVEHILLRPMQEDEQQQLP